MDSTQPADRPRTHPEINAQRRIDLIEGAIRSVAAHGLAGTTVQTISAAAGASRGLVAHYYGNKGELLVAAYRHLCDTIAQTMGDAARASGKGALDRLDAMLIAVFAEPIFEPVKLSAFLTFWHEARTDPAMAAINHELYRDYRAVVARLFERAAAERGTAIDARIAALGLIALIDGFWVELTIDPQAFTVDEALAACRAYVARFLAPTPV
jgi:TetR/AcrR family transcriptional regulator, transcriptional repressor of bet genes